MKLSHHVAVSTAVSGILHVLFESWVLTIASFLSGIFIDLDHYMDYLIEFGSPLNISKFFHCIYEEKLKRCYLVFHGWEWLIILFMAGWISNWNHWIVGILIGCGQHLVLDLLINNNWPLLGYSVLWRWKRNFVSERIRPRKKDFKKNKY